MTAKEKSMSMETRSTSITSDISDQEIPPTTPRSDPALSPSTEAPQPVTTQEHVEKLAEDTADIMTTSHLIT